MAFELNIEGTEAQKQKRNDQIHALQERLGRREKQDNNKLYVQGRDITENLVFIFDEHGDDPLNKSLDDLLWHVREALVDVLETVSGTTSGLTQATKDKLNLIQSGINNIAVLDL